LDKVDYKQKTVLVCDHGMYVHVAIKLVQYFGKVLYYTDWQCAFPTCEPLLVGEGFEGVTRIKDIFNEGMNADLYVFTDIYFSGLQQELLRQGKRVWGPRNGDELEIFRWRTKQMLPSLGLPMPPGEKITGIAKLRAYLKKHDDVFVKVSGLRGMMETHHHDNYDLSLNWLDRLEAQISGVKDVITFIVDSKVGTDEDTVEVGFDGWTIDGQYPEIASFGYELKDCGLLSVVRPYSEFPEPITKVMDAFGPVLQDHYYRGFCCAEIRVNKEGSWMIDWASRCGSPSSEALMEFYSNWPEILWFGAEGRLIKPEQVAKFGVEIVLHSPNADPEEWKVVQIDDKARPWIKMHNWAIINGRDTICPQEFPLKEFGAIVGIGDTLEEAIKSVREHCDGVKSSDVEFKHDSIEDGLKEIKKGEELGIDFGADLDVDKEGETEEV
jgi:phosphoribosylamine-glycine ligase